jgi:PAS domain S-box-containing protein
MRKRDSSNPKNQNFSVFLFSLFLFAGSVISPGHAYAGSTIESAYLVDIWGTDQGLPEESATAMVQTPDGYLWFGTFNGLVRFDGVKFTVFDRSNTPELPSPGIVNLHLDRSGRLWVSTLLGVAYVKNGHWRVFHESDGWVGNFVWRFAETKSGDLYMSTFDHKILRFRDNRFWEMLPPPVSNPALGFQLYVDGSNSLWVVNPQFIGKLVDEKWQEMISAALLLKKDQFGPRPALMAGVSRDGGLWIATSRTLRKYHSSQVVQETRAPWVMESLWNLYEDSTGGVWIASSAAGLYHFSADQGWRHLTAEKPLPYHSVRFVFEDREQNLWVGTSGGGLARFKRRYLTNWGLEQGLPERVVKSVAADSRGTVYFGTWGKGVVRIAETTIVPVMLPHDSRVFSRDGSCRLFDGLVNSTLVDHKGRLWVSTFSDGLFLLDGRTCQGFFTSAGDSPQVSPLFEDSTGRIWIGTQGGAFSFDGEQFHKYLFDVASEHTGLRSIAEDAQNKILWAGNRTGGLFRFDGKQFIAVAEAKALVNEELLALFADKDGTLWIGTEDSGIACLRNGYLTRISEHEGVPARTIGSIVGDDSGNLWFGSDRGILRASRAELDDLISGRTRAVRFQIFTRSDGLATADCSVGSQPASTRDPAGRLWFATSRGVVTVDPAKLRLNPIPPPTAIEDVIVDGQTAGVTEEFRTSQHNPSISLTIPPGDHSIEIHYAGLSYTAPEKVRFRYILEGSDKEWNEVGDRRIAYFYHLRPGHYRFRVTAANNDGVWNNTGLSAELYVRPYFYQTYQFLGLCLFAVVVAGTGAYRVRINHLRHRERELEELVRLRDQELHERKRFESELRHSEDKFAKTFRSSPAAMSITSTRTGQVMDVNETFTLVFGFSSAEVVGRTATDLQLWASPSERERVLATLKTQRAVRNFVTQFRTQKGRIFDAVFSAEIVSFGAEECLLSVALDITEQRQLEERLRQSQKMEAVGKLAGGVAHDFNNLLTIIRGYSHMVLSKANDEDIRTHAEKIDQAAERASALTSQLLAFSRHQVLQPKVFDLNALVLDMEKMLQRLIGEDIEMLTFTAPDLGAVRADPGQIEQVIMNLAVNARDAMPGGGRLTLETTNVELDEEYARAHVGAQVGHYVMLAVSDNGVGMSADTIGRIFEPFFTTKELGKGTGLGLSMVYGIVRQSGGNIWVYSEPGKGSTFKIYLPRVDAPTEVIGGQQTPIAASRGTETILLVEDDQRVRELAHAVLTRFGYNVVVAENSLSVGDLCERHDGPIHLLLTDVVMPGLSGREVARRVTACQPNIKVLYMSGYTTNAIVHQGELDGGTSFLPKPFTPESLNAKVREVLDQRLEPK